MNSNQDANWCVTRPWFDYVMGTRVVSSADLKEANPLGLPLPAPLSKALTQAIESVFLRSGLSKTKVSDTTCSRCGATRISCLVKMRSVTIKHQNFDESRQYFSRPCRELSIKSVLMSIFLFIL